MQELKFFLFPLAASLVWGWNFLFCFFLFPRITVQKTADKPGPGGLLWGRSPGAGGGRALEGAAATAVISRPGRDSSNGAGPR